MTFYITFQETNVGGKWQEWATFAFVNLGKYSVHVLTLKKYTAGQNGKVNVKTYYVRYVYKKMAACISTINVTQGQS